MKTGIFQLDEEDRPALAEHLLGLNREDRRLRFFSPVGDSIIERFVQNLSIDRVFGFFLSGVLVATSMVMPEAEDPVEFAVSVDEHHRGRGLARQLLEHGLTVADAQGVEKFVIRHASENRAMAALHRGLPTQQHHSAGEVDVIVDLQELQRQACDTMSRLCGEEL